MAPRPVGSLSTHRLVAPHARTLLPPLRAAARAAARRAAAAAPAAAAAAGGAAAAAAALAGAAGAPPPPPPPLLAGAGAGGLLPGLTGRDPSRRATDALILANAVLFGLQLASKEALTVWGAKVNHLILAGQWWRLLTPAFLHGSLVHLAVNCYSLASLGPAVEAAGGPRRLAAVYAAAAVAGNAASLLGSAAPSLGASGAVFGVGGALALYFHRHRGLFGDRRSDAVLRQLGQTLGVNVVYGLMNPRIDNWGHLGGLLGGAAAAWLLGPRWRVRALRSGGAALVDEPPLPWLAAPARRVRG